MRYRKATEVLPEELVEAIQKYMDGGYVYIPRKEENKKKWGEETSFRGESLRPATKRFIVDIWMDSV